MALSYRGFNVSASVPYACGRVFAFRFPFKIDGATPHDVMRRGAAIAVWVYVNVAPCHAVRGSANIARRNYTPRDIANIHKHPHTRREDEGEDEDEDEETSERGRA